MESFTVNSNNNSATACPRGFGWSPLSERSNRASEGHPPTVYSEKSQEPGTVGGEGYRDMGIYFESCILGMKGGVGKRGLLWESRDPGTVGVGKKSIGN